MKNLIYYITRGAVWLILHCLFGVLRVRIFDRKNVPAKGGLIVCPNHLSFADPLLVACYLPRYTYFMATDEMFNIRILSTLCRILRTFPVKQDSPDRKALRYTENLLKSGESVMIFPEGHVSKDGKMLPLQAGVILMAVRSGASVLPVGIVNSPEITPLSTYKVQFPKKPVHVRFGKPISVEELTGGKTGREALEYGVTYLAEAIAALSGQSFAEPLSSADEPREETRAAASPASTPAA
jgi:1-acyl-sn-glycerol-3-phosphate acyltransferase